VLDAAAKFPPKRYPTTGVTSTVWLRAVAGTIASRAVAKSRCPTAPILDRTVPEARRPGEAILLLREMTALPGHVFWSDDTSIARSPWIAAERLVAHGQVTDAHLVALSLRRKGRLATFDRGVADVLPKGVDAGAVLTLLQP
jgi:predicted nucleic acid-binding protein